MKSQFLLFFSRMASKKKRRKSFSVSQFLGSFTFRTITCVHSLEIFQSYFWFLKGNPFTFPSFISHSPFSILSTICFFSRASPYGNPSSPLSRHPAPGVPEDSLAHRRIPRRVSLCKPATGMPVLHKVAQALFPTEIVICS